MTYTIPTGIDAETLVKRIFWLAFQAAGGPVGYGVFQDRPGIDEEAVWSNVQNDGDYNFAGTVPNPFSRSKLNDWYGDYVFGRMLKLGVQVNDRTVTLPEDKYARPDYQGWMRVYPSYSALYQAAVESLVDTTVDSNA